MPEATNRDSEDSRVKTCPDCEGRKYLERIPSDEEILNGSYYPSDLISIDCETCEGMGEIEECVNCHDIFSLQVEETYLNEWGMCFTCASIWQLRPRSAISWESDIDGLTLFYHTEVSPDLWIISGSQSQHSSKVNQLNPVRNMKGDPKLTTTDKLTWCADGGVIIGTDGTFVGIET